MNEYLMTMLILQCMVDNSIDAETIQLIIERYESKDYDYGILMALAVNPVRSLEFFKQ